jgi:hypothetical protein
MTTGTRARCSRHRAARVLQSKIASKADPLVNLVGLDRFPETPGVSAAGPEFRLLLLCAGDAGSHSRARIEPILKEGVDWDRVVHLADDHGVLPLLAQLVDAVGAEVVPPSTRDRLRDYVRASGLRSRMLALELVRLLDLFEARGIAAIPHKGPVLAAMAYGRLDLRQYRDLDVVVREADLAAATRLLEDQGYHLVTRRLTPAQKRLHNRSTGQYEYVSADALVHVDLHWSIVPRGFPFKIAHDRLWSALEPVSLEGKTVKTFSVEDLLQLLSVHGTKDSWCRLVWVCDIDRLVRSRPRLDWHAILSTAIARRGETMLLLGLTLAADLLETPLPADVRDRAGAVPAVGMLARKIAESLPGGRGPALSGLLECLGIKRLYFESCDRLVDRLSYACRTLVIPDTTDWARTRLPDPLFSLYYGLRPLHRAAKCAGILWRRLVALALGSPRRAADCG